jgi:prephenate dehydrogenase
MATNLLILGMNRLSTSLGLVMKNGNNIHRIGFDPDISNTRAALSAGALDQIVETLSEGVKSADVILYALPIGKMVEVFDSIRQDLKPGCYLVDLNPIGQDTIRQVSKVLPDSTRFIAWFAALNPKYIMDVESGPGGAQEDLFHNSHVYIAGDINAHPEALKLGNDLAVLAGAKPLNTEPEELSGILALGVDLPLLISAVTTGLVTSEPGWNEARKLAGFNFDHISRLLESTENQVTPESRIHINRKNIQRLLSLMIEQLSEIYTSLDEDSPKELGRVIHNAALARQIWQKQRATMSWLDQDRIRSEPLPSMGERLFGKRRI